MRHKVYLVNYLPVRAEDQEVADLLKKRCPTVTQKLIHAREVKRAIRRLFPGQVNVAIKGVDKSTYRIMVGGAQEG